MVGLTAHQSTESGQKVNRDKASMKQHGESEGGIKAASHSYRRYRIYTWLTLKQSEVCPGTNIAKRGLSKGKDIKGRFPV